MPPPKTRWGKSWLPHIPLEPEGPFLKHSHKNEGDPGAPRHVSGSWGEVGKGASVLCGFLRVKRVWDMQHPTGQAEDASAQQEGPWDHVVNNKTQPPFPFPPLQFDTCALLRRILPGKNKDSFREEKNR